MLNNIILAITVDRGSNRFNGSRLMSVVEAVVEAVETTVALVVNWQ